MKMTMATTTMLSERTKDSSITNGNGRFIEIRNGEPARFWTRIRMTEWTFSLSLLALSLTIVLGKLYTNYVVTFAQMYETMRFDMKAMDSERFLINSNRYTEVITNTLVVFFEKYWWLLRAMACGFLITSFTWFILYKDSSIPGVNPPTPFSPSRQRIREDSRIQMNYLVGALNGILFFIYLCL